MSNGEMINTSNIAQDCGVQKTTVQEYYPILVDTLLGYFGKYFCSSSGRVKQFECGIIAGFNG